jgi:lipopolysaccharide export system permease protein
MIFQRTLRRELLSTAGAVFTTLFTITITVMLIRILGRAAGGKIASEDVIALIGFTSLGYLPIILNLTGFITVLLVISRSYQDSEMVVWFASGQSLWAWIRPVMALGIPLVIITALLSMIVTPWAYKHRAEFQERFQKREDIARISPGRFQESSSADRVFFVEGASEDQSSVRNIFVNTVKDGRNSVVVAREGRIETDEHGGRFLVLQEGRRYDGMPGQPDFQVMEFERYAVLVSRQTPVITGDTTAKALPTLQLLEKDNKVFRGELLSRIASPVMGLLLMLLAIPLSYVNPRSGRSANLIVALLLFVVYSNMVNVFRNAVIFGQLPFSLAWWPVHAIAGLAIVGLFSWRLNVNSRYHPLVIWNALMRKIRFRRQAA